MTTEGMVKELKALDSLRQMSTAGNLYAGS